MQLREMSLISPEIEPGELLQAIETVKLLRSVGEGMLLMWDRGLHSDKIVNGTYFEMEAILMIGESAKYLISL